ncbi:PilN domain-containing protein [Salinisphaera hydrothermalis]|uniref:Fimbrial assembly family protein n=1 Tax=Salinisphaera hydrothermalis (strain C41B8) TaxID=1304275 RepID=A0A084IRC3_SALHC|nr:PilN domain-containing protein [Salinisphaera hydrothermalis]KEZ79257.1 Fimbrial assembly family protein [Salinisphaera hydrothermalis C41B8]
MSAPQSLAVRINLLDWRAEQREYKRKRFIGQLVGAAVATVVVVGVLPVIYYDHLISAQQARNNYLQQQIATADKQLGEIRELKKTRENLVNRMQVIGALQKSRSAIVHYFDQLTATIPDGVYLTALDESGDTTTLNGVAESNARVSQYMTNLDNSAWFTNPRLIVIKRDDSNGQRRADFTLKVDSTSPEQTKRAAPGDAADKGQAS